MAESNEEPPVCPCGFWGSAQTSGLCSVCYKRQQQQNKDHESKLFVSTSNAVSSISTAATTSTGTSLTSTSGWQPSVPEVMSTAEAASSAGVPRSVAVGVSSSCDTSDTSSQDTNAAASEAGDGQDELPSRPVQKNKKRCFVCKARLELAFVEIGRCRCGYTFCELHRLPEQHACTYDHKESGRQEAREKMVSPKKHVGTTLRRLDSDT